MATTRLLRASLAAHLLLLVIGNACYGQTAVQGPSHGYRWGNLRWSGPTVQGVGDITLPAGVTLPSWLSPIGNGAMVFVPPPTRHYVSEQGGLQCVVYFWFHEEQRQRITDWLDGFPAAFVFPADSFSLIDPCVEAHIVSAADSRNWEKVSRTAKGWRYWQTLDIPSGTFFRESIDLRASNLRLPTLRDTDLYGMSLEFAPAIRSLSSPVRQETSLILISLSFSAWRR
jgi:hypothetical protein